MAIDLEDITSETDDHVVQFYQRDKELVRTVGGYLRDALWAGEVTIAVATVEHLAAINVELGAGGIDLAEARRNGRFISLDAAQTLSRFLNAGRVDRDGFARVIGGVLTRAAEGGRPLRVYGEMVSLLWDGGNVSAAIDLEGEWNIVRRQLPFSLLCSYRTPSDTGVDTRDELREICHLHSAVVAADGGRASASGPVQVSRRFAAEVDAPRAARWFVLNALRTEGDGGVLAEDAALVVTELAVNALIHARSPFVVSISTDSDFVRISVRDGSPYRPLPRDAELMAQTGRGLALVDALARRWGVELSADGKVVWVELRR